MCHQIAWRVGGSRLQLDWVEFVVLRLRLMALMGQSRGMTIETPAKMR
ncbi:MAG: hypothetical protein ACI8VW_002361 [bacterium]|jgi:hypothetical protein